MKYETLKAVPSNVQIQIYGQALAEKMALLANVQAGDKVTALFPGGLGLKDGKAVREYKERTGKVNPLLIFKDHIVINLGGRFGTPGYVDASTLVKVTRPAVGS